MTTNIEKLREQRNELNRQLRAAERAEKQAAAQALLAAKHGLGVWLADGLGRDTPESIEELKASLDLDSLRALVPTAPVTADSDDERAEQAEDVSTESDDDDDAERATDESLDASSSPYGHEGGQRVWN